VVYDNIKHSNSSLKRRSKRLLEDSIERVLLVLKEEQDDSDSLAGDFDGIEEPPPVLKVSGMGNS
jgi:ribosome biogenesis ATPase